MCEARGAAVPDPGKGVQSRSVNPHPAEGGTAEEMFQGERTCGGQEIAKDKDPLQMAERKMANVGKCSCGEVRAPRLAHDLHVELTYMSNEMRGFLHGFVEAIPQVLACGLDCRYKGNTSENMALRSVHARPGNQGARQPILG